MSVRVGDEIVAGGQGDMYTKAQVDALIANAIAQTTEKPGMIKPFAGTTVPTGYLLCDGSAVSRTTYANLFSAIGTTYGSGDGSTTFNLPDLVERVPRMTSSYSRGVKNSGWAPDIQGTFKVIFHSNSWNQMGTGAFAPQGGAPSATIGGGSYCNNYTIGFLASRSWAGYNSSVSSISAANLTMFWAIKY